MRRSVLLGWALAASLALNAGLIGYLAGQSGRDGRGGGPGGGFVGAVRAVAQTLSPEGQAAMREAARAARPEMRHARRAVRAARADVVALLRDADVDPTERERRFAAVRAATGELQEGAQRLLFDAAARLSPDDRAALIEGREAQLDRKPRGR